VGKKRALTVSGKKKKERLGGREGKRKRVRKGSRIINITGTQYEKGELVRVPVRKK